MSEQGEKLAKLETDYKLVMSALKKLDSASNVKREIDALVRIKDIAKLALQEQQSSVAQVWKQEELITDVGTMKPKTSRHLKASLV